MTPRAVPASVLSASVALVALLALAGCSTSGGSADSSAEYDRAPAAGAGAPAGSGSGGDTAAGGVADSAGDSSAADREVITTGWATITVDDPTDAAADTARIVESAGGRVDARTVTAPTDDDAGGADLTVRIPSERLTPTLDALEALGEVEQVSLSDADVTETVQDLDARITAGRTSADRLLALLAEADTTKDLIAIESALQQRQADLESMETQQRYYADQVAMATVQVSLIAVEDAPADTPRTFLDGLSGGWGAFVAFLGGALVVLGAALPWLVFLALLGGIAFVVVRARRRRAATRAAATGSTSDASTGAV